MRYLFLILILSTSYHSLRSQNIYDGLVGYWPMNCNAIDSLGTDMNGTIQGNPECQEGKLNESLNFDEGDYIQLPSDRTLEMVSQNGFTWSMWFKLDSLPQDDNTGLFQTFISFADPANQSDIFLGLGSLTADKDELAFIVDGPGGVGNSAQNNRADLKFKPEGFWQKDIWYHIAGLRDYENNLVELYFNGIKVDSSSYETPQQPFSENFPMQFARFYDGETASNNFTGNLDEIRIYDRVLTEEEVLILFSARPEQLSSPRETVDFSNIKCKNDSTILLNIRNEGPSEFIISEFDLRQGEAFKIENPVSDEKLLNQETYVLGLTFDPPSEGVFYDTLFVRNPFGVQPLIIYLEGEKEVNIEVPDSIDFGELVSCESNSFLVAEIEIENINIDDGLIFKGIELPGSEIASATYNPLDEMNSGVYSLTFSPSSFGTFTEIGQITFANCDLTYPIEVSANYTILEKSYSSTFDFLEKEVGIEYTETQTFTNSGTTDIEILGLEFKGESGEFSYNSDTFQSGIVLNPSDTFGFDISFLPEGRNASDTLIITSSSRCGTATDTILYFGYGKFRANFDLKVQDISAKIGDEKDLILELNNPIDLDISEIDSINFNLIFNETTSVPLNAANSISSSTFDIWYSSYSFSISPELENENQQFNLGKVKLALGNESAPLIEISDLEVFGGLASVNQEPGAIFMEDICEAGELTRLFFAEEWLELGDVSPNPATDQITFNFSLIEPGITNVFIFDSNGLLIEKIASGYFDPGTYEVKYQTYNLNSGSYFYVLQTPTQKISKRFHIVK